MEAAIERNRAALVRIVSSLVVMAATAGGGPTLPRHLWRAVLRLLRPAEAAARRLIIAAARGLVVAPTSPRKTGPKPVTSEPFLRSLGIAVVVSPAARAGRFLPCKAGRRTTRSVGAASDSASRPSHCSIR